MHELPFRPLMCPVCGKQLLLIVTSSEQGLALRRGEDLGMDAETIATIEAHTLFCAKCYWTVSGDQVDAFLAIDNGKIRVV